MMSTEPVEFQFSADEIHELLNLFQNPCTFSSGSETNRSVYSVEERKHRRMISNRESARRSRQRKKRQLENLTAEMNRLEGENRELKQCMALATNQCQVVMRETQRLRSEYINLQTRLSSLYEMLVSMQLQQNYH